MVANLICRQDVGWVKRRADPTQVAISASVGSSLTLAPTYALCARWDGNYSRPMADEALPGRGIRAEDHDSYRILGGRADAGLILLCDHAGNAVPEPYGTLGLPPEQLKRHIAYDIGAAQVTANLAAALGAPAVVTC